MTQCLIFRLDFKIEKEFNELPRTKTVHFWNITNVNFLSELLEISITYNS